MRLAITILALSAVAYAGDWQTGKLEVHPTIVKGMFADYPGHLYRESQAGYTCTDGDADNAPVCISDEHSTVVVTPGYATVTLADGLQFEVPDYTHAGLVYDPHFIIQDDMYCMDNVYRPKGVGYITSGYQCTVFKRLVLKLTFPGGLGFAFQGKPTEQKTYTFQYRLAKSRKGGEQEIDIKGVGKGVYIATRLSSSPTPAAHAAPDTAAARKQFVKTVFESVKERAPGFNITADGPDADTYVLHFPGMNYAKCQGVFTTEAVSEVKAAGFTQYVCTDDGNTRFEFDVTANESQGPGPSPSNQGQPIPHSESARAQTAALSCPPLGHCLAMLRSGFSVRHEHRLVMGTTTRLYLSVDDSTFTDIPTDEITGYAKERTPEATASPEKLTQAQSRPAVKPTPGPANTPNLIAQQQSQPNSSASGALIVKPDRPQPFGFHARMTEREAIAAVGRAAVKAGYPKPMPYGSVLLLTTAPKPNSSFEDYALKFSTEGLFEVWTHTPGIHSADDGTQVRDEFNDLRKLIAGKYGEPKCFDFRDAGTSDRPDFFMLYLKDKEQHLSCTWSVGTRSAAILLEAESLDIDTAIVGLKYQFYPEFEKARVGADDKKMDSF